MLGVQSARDMEADEKEESEAMEAAQKEEEGGALAEVTIPIRSTTPRRLPEPLLAASLPPFSLPLASGGEGGSGRRSASSFSLPASHRSISCRWGMDGNMTIK